jgi:hypothetical protein
VNVGGFELGVLFLLLLVVLTVVGVVITVVVLVVRRAGGDLAAQRPDARECPRCGWFVERGLTTCPKCAHDFAAALQR